MLVVFVVLVFACLPLLDVFAFAMFMFLMFGLVIVVICVVCSRQLLSALLSVLLYVCCCSLSFRLYCLVSCLWASVRVHCDCCQPQGIAPASPPPPKRSKAMRGRLHCILLYSARCDAPALLCVLHHQSGDEP